MKQLLRSSLTFLTFNFFLNDTLSYGNGVGVLINVGLILVAHYMGKTFEELSSEGRKIGEDFTEEVSKSVEMAEADDTALEEAADTSCGIEEEGQSAVLVKESKSKDAPKSYRL